MQFASDGNRPPWEDEWSGPLYPATSKERGQGPKASRFKSQVTQKETRFYQNRPNVTAIVGGCPVPKWMKRRVVSIIRPSETFFCCQLYLKRKKQEEKEKENSPNDYRGNGNIPAFTVANAILIKPKLLLRSFSSKYFSAILIFS